MVPEIKKYFAESRIFYSAAIILLIINLFFSYAYLRPEWKKAEELSREYFSLRKEKSGVRAELKRQQDYASLIKTMESDISSFVGELPAEREMTRIIKEMHALARKSGVTIKAAKYTPSIGKNKDLLHYTIVAPVSGSYSQVRKFIYNIEKVPYLMNIEDLGLTSGKENAVSLSLKISVYFRTD
ncbi:MAG: type 4a pilus biogenesis protein PilO [Proteobacteria bacterium]|nr:type 4a pilus biogenesis protein PilO [Pseudomonadota bacterium]